MKHENTMEIEAILSALSGSITIFDGFLHSISSDALGKKRGEGFWSIHEHADHLADVQPMILERMQRILTEDTPEFIPFIPDQEEPTEDTTLRTVEEILKQFKLVREEQLKLLTEAEPEDWAKSAVHPEYDRYGLFILARHALMHDHWHLYRMEELWLTKDEYLTRLEG